MAMLLLLLMPMTRLIEFTARTKKLPATAHV
jgi:hypothetical protein